MAIHVDISKLDELILLINNSVDEKQNVSFLVRQPKYMEEAGQLMSKN